MTKKLRAKKKFFSYTAGEKGRNRVRVYQKPSGLLMLEYYEHGTRRRVSLGHNDEARAKREADQVAATLRDNERPSVKRDLTIQTLFDIYEEEVTPGKSHSKQSHDRRCGAMFRRYFGSKGKVSALSIVDWNRFIRDRQEGRIRTRLTSDEPVGPRQIQYDLKHLRAVLHWATLSRVDGAPLLERNPLAGLPLPKETNPKRPVMSQQYYQRLLDVAQVVDRRFHLALVLAHETGHRIQSVRCLRWQDVDLHTALIVWPAEYDKQRKEHRTPLSEDARKALLAARSEQAVIGNGWIVPAVSDPSRPCSRGTLDHMFNRAEVLLGAEVQPGMRWHSLRRKLATDHKDGSLKVLCELGGWKSAHTVLECYQQADVESQRAMQANRHQPTPPTDTSGPIVANGRAG